MGNSPFSAPGLLTGVFIDHSLTRFAADVATPDEFTMAPLHVAYDLGVVATAATEFVTTALHVRLLLTLAPFCSHDAELSVVPAVIRRLRGVNEFLCRDGDGALLSSATSQLSLGAGRDKDRQLISVFQVVTDLLEAGHGSPA